MQFIFWDYRNKLLLACNVLNCNFYCNDMHTTLTCTISYMFIFVKSSTTGVELASFFIMMHLWGKCKGEKCKGEERSGKVDHRCLEEGIPSCSYETKIPKDLWKTFCGFFIWFVWKWRIVFGGESVESIVNQCTLCTQVFFFFLEMAYYIYFAFILIYLIF